jgi:ribosome-associated translation inhibitor RaiA
MEDKDIIQLGGNIDLGGFKDVDRAEMVVVRKIVGHYAKIMSEKKTGFSKLKVGMSKEGNDFKIDAEMTADKAYTGEETGNNLFIVLDAALKKIVSQI